MDGDRGHGHGVGMGFNFCSHADLCYKCTGIAKGRERMQTIHFFVFLYSAETMTVQQWKVCTDVY